MKTRCFYLLFSFFILINYGFLLSQPSFLPGVNVKIIESQSYNSAHVMDTVWRYVAQGMGFSASIVPQTTLDDTTFFSSTDILIVSSGVIDIPSNRVNTIQSFLMRKKNVYLQCEYQSTYASNLAFATIVANLGGSFNWGSTVSGNLAPMQILGSLSNTPNNVPSISYFWYGIYGSGNSTIENYMQFQSNYYGFIFTPTNNNYGIMITNSDQDWVRASTSLPLMQNILYKLALYLLPVQNSQNVIPKDFCLYQNYPNPFNPTTRIYYQLPGSSKVTIKIYDILGREVSTLVNEVKQPGYYEAEFNGINLVSGIYFYRIIAQQVGSSTGKFTNVKKMVLVK